MRKGKHKPLPTPGTNRKAWISGALNFYTGRLHWVSGGRKNDELFMKLLQELRRTYRSHKQLHLATDNDSSHASKRFERARPVASFAFMVSREQSGGVGVVLTARGREPQPPVRWIGRSDGVR
jgi:hypothetical protein